MAELVRLKLIQASMSGQIASVDTNGPVRCSATLLVSHYDLISDASSTGLIRGTCYCCDEGRAARRIYSPACLDYVPLTFCHVGANKPVSAWKPGILIPSAFAYVD